MDIFYIYVHKKKKQPQVSIELETLRLLHQLRVLISFNFENTKQFRCNPPSIFKLDKKNKVAVKSNNFDKIANLHKKFHKLAYAEILTEFVFLSIINLTPILSFEHLSSPQT